mmetsp:Transcript_7058/g.8126  ORF Transcript_7058/g.8126 Transcript_7058/m.8126 type:complete len:84 (-) Transcript_7058:279-530(-)
MIDWDDSEICEDSGIGGLDRKSPLGIRAAITLAAAGNGVTSGGGGGAGGGLGSIRPPGGGGGGKRPEAAALKLCVLNRTLAPL